MEYIGGREGIRTPGLLVANEALSQLSYSPTSSNKILADAPKLANRCCRWDSLRARTKRRLFTHGTAKNVLLESFFGLVSRAMQRCWPHGWSRLPPARCATI